MDTCWETHDEEKKCSTCAALYGEKPHWDGEKCISRCTRTRLVGDRELCIDTDACPVGLRLTLNG